MSPLLKILIAVLSILSLTTVSFGGGVIRYRRCHTASLPRGDGTVIIATSSQYVNVSNWFDKLYKISTN